MSRSADPFDELAAMFLTTPAVQTAEAPQSARPQQHLQHQPTTEVLLTGNLPVRGGLWLTPYADALARELGATALLRLDGEEPSLQVLRGHLDHSAAAAPSDLESLEQAIASLGPTIDHWIIRPPSGGGPAEAIQAGAQRITLLTSADEAAIVAAYQCIKDLAQAAEQCERPAPAVGLAIVGADLQCAREIVDRLARTTKSFLGVEIELVLCLPRMDAGVKSNRYVAFPSQPPCTLSDVMTWINAAAASASQSASTRQSSSVIGQLYTDRTDDQVLDAAEVLRLSDGESASPRRAQKWMRAGGALPGPPAPAPAPGAEAAPQPVKLAPKPAGKTAIDIEPKQPARASEPDHQGQPVPLATHVHSLVALPIRSPGHERIELAVDRSGRLHLLGRDAAATALREMTIVEAWAKAHRELIAMACPQHPIDPSSKAVCHLFTDQPAALADLHGTGLRLHVLAPVVVNGHTGWYAAPLNAG